ncbi:MAG: BatD family protein [Chitinophagaceae bacterium]|nr:BatD family protein [Chitinophagaceae bacterium]
MSRPTKYLILFLLVVFCNLHLRAQELTRIQAKADRTAILIGEPITLSLQADIPENAPIRFFRIDSLPHFEVLDRGKIDTTNTGYGTILKQQVRITSYDSGSWVIPAFALQEDVVSDSIAVEVSYTPYNPDQPYHDIKDIIDAKEEEKESMKWWWYAAGAAFVIILVFYLVFRGKKQAPPPAPVVTRDAFAEAKKSLQQLRESKLDGKTWFTRLVDIFRLYADERKNIHSQQQTSEDLLVQLKATGLSEHEFGQIAQALRLSDFVKFAKYEPTDQDRDQSWKAINDAIEQLEKLN